MIASRHDQFRPGHRVHGAFGVQEHAVSDGQGAYKLEVNERLTPAAYLGVPGLTGLTDYFGRLDIGRLVEGETVLVFGAAGGVGTDVGAIDYERRDVLDQLRERTPDRVGVPGECSRFCSRDFVGRLPAVSAAAKTQIAAFVRLSRAVGGVSALSTELAGSYCTALEADGVEPVGRRVDTAPSEGRADVR